MKYKNYYKILGLKSSKVTDEEIKSAYRKLAKKYHPDRNPGDLNIAEKFKDVNEAYQTLINEESKRKYNRIHFAYSIKDGSHIRNLKEKLDMSGASEFVEMFFGKQEIKKKPKSDLPVTGENLESELNLTLEEAFHGVNKKVAFKTEEDKVKTIDIKVPKGIVNGGKIRIKGQGKKGKNGAEPGDLFIKVKILENNKYQLENANLRIDLPITPSEAALGCKIKVDGIEDIYTIEIPAGTGTGEEFPIVGKGYYDESGNRGDFIAQVKIMVPRDISKEERELYEKLQKITSFMPRKN